MKNGGLLIRLFIKPVLKLKKLKYYKIKNSFFNSPYFVNKYFYNIYIIVINILQKMLRVSEHKI